MALEFVALWPFVVKTDYVAVISDIPLKQFVTKIQLFSSVCVQFVNFTYLCICIFKSIMYGNSI